MDSASSDHIFNSFTASTKEDWLKAAKLELDGADPFQKLTQENSGLTILPYYDERNVSIDRFQFKAAANEFLGARAWHNMPLIAVTSESESNRRAISELNSGADGIFFNITNSKTDITALLEKIEWPYCSVSFLGNISDQFLNSLHDYVVERKFDVATLNGCIFGDRLFENGLETFKLFESWSNFHPLGIEITEKESPAEEIGTALAQAVKEIDFLTENGISSKKAMQAHAFHMPIGEDFFITIAKLKVLRILWYNVSLQFGIQSPVPTIIHATSMPWIRKEFQPNSNLIKSTTAALSAILGGCDALTIIPEESDNTMMERVATNVSSVLREEAQLSRVADPTAGSYYLESLIDQLAGQAWRSFQKQVNS